MYAASGRLLAVLTLALSLDACRITPTNLYQSPDLSLDVRAEIQFEVDGLFEDRPLISRQRAWVEILEPCRSRGVLREPSAVGNVVNSKLVNPSRFALPALQTAALRLVYFNDSFLGAGGRCDKEFAFDPQAGATYDLKFLVNRYIYPDSFCGAELKDRRTSAPVPVRKVEEVSCAS